MKILVADDDRVSLMMMRRMLLQSGFEVTTASDGPGAVEGVLQQGGPRLLLLDWMMPSLNGPEVCKRIRAAKTRGYVYIVLLTAKDTKDDLIAGLEAGADDFLTKPCHPEELTARLRAGQRVLSLEDGLVQARDEMHFKATHDALTTVLNRGAIVQELADHLARVRYQHESSAVLLCDVDHFKHINDTYGHPVGDEILQGVARRLESVALKSDAVGRFGGEEFMLLLNKIDMKRLMALGENVCEVISSGPIETSAGSIRVSISLGALGIGCRDRGTLDDILKAADRLLYRAKREGRNRAVADEFSGTPLLDGERPSPVFPPALLFT